MNETSLRRLRRALSVALALSILVLFAGATVRATGSGMGCPDWPLCYGCWIPPLSVDQLPDDYETTYAVEGQPAQFDAMKTWIEYINRLLGAVAGLAMVVCLVLSFFVLRRPLLVLLVWGAFVALGGAAWLGAKVVDTALAPYAVTVHLLSAYLLIALLLGALELCARSLEGPRGRPPRPVVLSLALVGLAFLVQWTLGIRTREEIEAWIWSHQLAEGVWSLLGGAYNLHKLTGVVVLGATLWLGWNGWRGRGSDPRLGRLTLVCLGLVGAQAVVGLVLWWGDLPLWAKPLHLLLGTGAWTAWLGGVFHSLPSREVRHGSL